MDVFRQAVANDPTLAGADAERLRIAEGVPQARSQLLPQISAGLGFEQIRSGEGRTTTDASGNVLSTSGGGYTRDRDLSGTLRQPIINIADIENLRAAHASSDAQEQTYRAALQNLYVRVAQAYFNVLAARHELAIFRSYEDAYKREYEQAAERYKDGLAASADMTQSQAYYLNIKAQRISQQNALRDARRALQQITGKLPGDLLDLREDMPMKPPVPGDPEAWVKRAMATNPSILAARYAVSADQRSIQAARAGHLPTLDAVVSYDKAGSWSNVARGGAGYGPHTTVVGLTLNVPLFTGGYTQSQVRQAIHQRDEDQDTLEAQRRQAARDAYNYYHMVVDGVEQVHSDQVAVQAAKKSLASIRAGYDIGTQSLTNVVVAIETLAQIEGDYTNVRYNFVLNQLLLKQAAGVIDVKDLEAVNRLLQ